MNQDIMRRLGFSEQVDRVNSGKCPLCVTEIDPEKFRDEESLKEYQISGLCQTCQDEMFGQ